MADVSEQDISYVQHWRTDGRGGGDWGAAPSPPQKVPGLRGKWKHKKKQKGREKDKGEILNLFSIFLLKVFHKK